MKDVLRKNNNVKTKKKAVEKDNKEQLLNRPNAGCINFAVSNHERMIEANKTGSSLIEKDIRDTEKFSEYTPSQNEKNSNSIPQKFMQLSNGYGSLSIGMNTKKELMSVASKRRNEDGSTVYRDSAQVDGTRTSKDSDITGDFLFNNIRPDKSAVGYKESSEKDYIFMLERFKTAIERSESEVLETVAPFLSTRDEVRELRELRDVQASLRDAGENDPDSDLSQRLEFLGSVLTNKEHQKAQFIKKLSDAITEVRAGKRGRKFQDAIELIRRLINAADDEDNEVDNSNI